MIPNLDVDFPTTTRYQVSCCFEGITKACIGPRPSEATPQYLVPAPFHNSDQDHTLLSDPKIPELCGCVRGLSTSGQGW